MNNQRFKIEIFFNNYLNVINSTLEFIRPKYIEIDYNDYVFILLQSLFFFSQSLLHSTLPILLVQLFTDIFGSTLIGNFTRNILICSLTYSGVRSICEYIFYIETKDPDPNSLSVICIPWVSIISSILNMIVKNESTLSMFLISIFIISIYSTPFVYTRYKNR